MNERVAIAVHVAGPGRTETLQGRDFRVFPAVLVRSQVLSNNLGRTFLPASDITQEWAEVANGAPVVIAHPNLRGAPTSARSPEVLNAMGVGFLFRTKAANGELTGDVFLDPSRATDVADLTVILEKLDKGEKVELSTGFPVMVEELAGVANGKEYDRTIHPAGFDHLAVFASQIGACSVKDGCGLAANHEGDCDVQDPAPDLPDPPAPEAAAQNTGWRRFVSAAAALLGFRKAGNESDEDRWRTLASALREKFAGEDRFVYVESVDSTTNVVVWVVEVDGEGDGGGLFQAEFTIDDNGAVTLGEPTQVRRVTTFEPVANTGDHSQEGDMDRKQMIAQLVAAGTLDEPALNKLNDCQLKALMGAGSGQADNQQTGDGYALAHQYRRELEELRASTATAVENEKREREKLLDDVLYARNRAYSDEEVKAMDIVNLRKLHQTMFPPRADYTGRGGPRTNVGNSFDFVQPIMSGPRGESVLDRQEAN